VCVIGSCPPILLVLAVMFPAFGELPPARPNAVPRVSATRVFVLFVGTSGGGCCWICRRRGIMRIAFHALYHQVYVFAALCAADDCWHRCGCDSRTGWGAGWVCFFCLQGLSRRRPAPLSAVGGIRPLWLAWYCLGCRCFPQEPDPTHFGDFSVSGLVVRRVRGFFFSLRGESVLGALRGCHEKRTAGVWCLYGPSFFVLCVPLFGLVLTDDILVRCLSCCMPRRSSWGRHSRLRSLTGLAIASGWGARWAVVGRRRVGISRDLCAVFGCLRRLAADHGAAWQPVAQSIHGDQRINWRLSLGFRNQTPSGGLRHRRRFRGAVKIAGAKAAAASRAQIQSDYVLYRPS